MQPDGQPALPPQLLLHTPPRHSQFASPHPASWGPGGQGPADLRGSGQRGGGERVPRRQHRPRAHGRLHPHPVSRGGGAASLGMAQLGVGGAGCMGWGGKWLAQVGMRLRAPSPAAHRLSCHPSNPASQATLSPTPTPTLPPRRSCDPLDLQRLPFAGDLWFVLVNPRFEAPTAEMRAVLPKEIPMKQVGVVCFEGIGGACLHRPLCCPRRSLCSRWAELHALCTEQAQSCDACMLSSAQLPLFPLFVQVHQQLLPASSPNLCCHLTPMLHRSSTTAPWAVPWWPASSPAMRP